MLRRIAGVAGRACVRGGMAVVRPGVQRPVAAVGRRYYWKVGGQDPFFAALLDLDATEIVRLGREPDEGMDEVDLKRLSHAMHALWSLAKVDEPQRAALRGDHDIHAFVHDCIDRALQAGDEDLCCVTIEYLHMAEHDVVAMDELEGPLTKAAETFPENMTIVHWRVPLPEHSRTGA